MKKTRKRLKLKTKEVVSSSNKRKSVPLTPASSSDLNVELEIALEKKAEMNDFLKKYLVTSSNYEMNLDDFTFSRSFLNSDNQLKLSDEINDLRKKLKEALKDLDQTKTDRENKIESFEKIRKELLARKPIIFCLE